MRANLLPRLVGIILLCLTSSSQATRKPSEQSSAGFSSATIVAVNGKSFEDCYRAAIQRSETVGMQQEMIKQAEDNYHQLVGAVIPNISAAGSYQWQQNTAGSYSNLYPSPSSSTRLVLTQPLFQGFKEFAGLRQAKTLVKASENDRKQAATQLYEDTAAAYFAVVADENDIFNIKEELGYYDRRISELNQFVSIGRNQITDVLTARSQQAALLAQMKQVEGDLRAQRAVLAFLTGFEPDFGIKIPADQDAPIRNITEYLSRVDSRPDVLGDTERRKSSEEGIPIARSGHLPTLMFQGDYYLERTGPLKDVSWDALLTLSIPIFSGGLVNAQVEQAVSKRDQSELQVSRTRGLATQQIRQFYENFMGSRNEFLAFKDATELSEKNYKEEVKNFRRGLVTNLDVLTALTTFEESKRSQDKARYAMLQNFADVEAAAAFRPEPQK